MTEHPLNDGKCMSLFSFGQLMDASQPITVEDSMRTAADWQLGEVIEWLKSELGRGGYLKPEGYSGYEIDVDDVIEDLKEAMRPTQQEDK